MNKMKSTKEQLQKRGLATQEEIDLLNKKTSSELIDLLHSDCATTRTSAVYNLCTNDEGVVIELLKQLSVEKCLYTKIAICESLERGNIDTVKEMVKYLGKIGNNQHSKFTDSVSKKKSFPLPRDIIARSLGKMNTIIFPILIDVLWSSDIKSISEVLDSIGFMVFYNQELSTEKNADVIYEIMEDYSDNDLIIWKAILCLSAFPLETTRGILNRYSLQNNILGKEARRSLSLIESK